MLAIKSDIKYIFRQILKSPGFALMSIIILAGGLSLSLFTISFVNTMVFKAVPLPDGDRIIEVCGKRPSGACLPLRAYEFASIRDEIETLEGVGVYRWQSRQYVQSDELFAEAMVAQTEANMFQFAESAPVLGRIFSDSDYDAVAEPVAVLSHDFWQLAFSLDPTVLNSHINLNGVLTRVIGVMPPGFTFPRWTDIWIPAEAEITSPVVNAPVFVSIYGYLKVGVSNAEASQEIDNLLFRMRQQNPFDESSTAASSLSSFEKDASSVDSGYVTSLPRQSFQTITDKLIFSIIIMLSIVLFLLACINVGTLLLARTNERMKDISICVALGAPRRRLLMQTMGESIVISVFGTSLAILLTGLWLEGLNIFMTTLLSEEGIEFWWDFKIDSFTILLAAGFAFFTVLTTSAIPSWRLINGDFNSVMRDGTRGALGLSTGRFSKSLVIVAVVLISILIYTFTVFGTVMYSLSKTYRLVEPEGIYSLDVRTNNQFDNAAERLQFSEALREQLNQHPDIYSVLLAGVTGIQRIGLEGESYLSEQDKPSSLVQVISGDLGFLGTNLLEGRLLDSRDTAASERVAMVSRYTAHEFWPQQSPIGQSLIIDLPGQQGVSETFRVVGMVSDTPMNGDSLFTQAYDMIYLPLGQMDTLEFAAIIRTSGDEQASTKLIGDTILRLNSGVSFNIMSWVENRQATGFVITSAITVFSLIGVFAFLVSTAGVFGLTKNSILLRTQEIGTRRALGASDAMISRDFTLQGAKQTLTGMLIALLICGPFAYLIASLAGGGYIVPGTIVSMFALLILFLCTLAAIYQPIRKLLKQEPSDLLRHV